MGAYAAKCMISNGSKTFAKRYAILWCKLPVTAGEEITMDFCFELFTHVTKFFGYKVCSRSTARFYTNSRLLDKIYCVILCVCLHMV
jgi:hypothetical protein